MILTVIIKFPLILRAQPDGKTARKELHVRICIVTANLLSGSMQIRALILSSLGLKIYTRGILLIPVEMLDGP
jgi:hypothetical protein